MSCSPGQKTSGQEHNGWDRVAVLGHDLTMVVTPKHHTLNNPRAVLLCASALTSKALQAPLRPLQRSVRWRSHPNPFIEVRCKAGKPPATPWHSGAFLRSVCTAPNSTVAFL